LNYKKYFSAHSSLYILFSYTILHYFTFVLKTRRKYKNFNILIFKFNGICIICFHWKCMKTILQQSQNKIEKQIFSWHRPYFNSQNKWTDYNSYWPHFIPFTHFPWRSMTVYMDVDALEHYNYYYNCTYNYTYYNCSDNVVNNTGITLRGHSGIFYVCLVNINVHFRHGNFL